MCISVSGCSDWASHGSIPEASGPKQKGLWGRSEEGGSWTKWRLTTMTTEIINIAGQIGHWLNVLVARQIAAQAAKLPH